MKLTSVLLIIGLVPAAALADPEEKKYGFWVETYSGIDYWVDTKAQICFVSAPHPGGTSIALVPCEKLALREEWKPIIKWVQDK